MTSTPPAMLPSEDGHTPRFSFEPLASPNGNGNEDPVIRVVRLRSDEHAGPFWDDEGCIGDDYDELRRWVGISRPLFDDVMAWNERFARGGAGQLGAESNARYQATRVQLLRRLRSEVHPGIDVQ